MSRFPWQQSAAIAGAAVAPLMALTGFFSVAPMIRKKEPATESIMSFLPEDLKKSTRWVSNYCTNLIASQTLLPGQTGIIDRRRVYPVIAGVMGPGSAIITISKQTDIYCVGMAHVDEYSDILQTITKLEQAQEYTAGQEWEKFSITKEPFIINIVRSKGYANDDPSDIISKRETLKINNDIVVDGEITVYITVGSGLCYLRPTSEAEKNITITSKHTDRASSMPKSLPNKFVLSCTRYLSFQNGYRTPSYQMNSIADLLKAGKSSQEPVAPEAPSPSR